MRILLVEDDTEQIEPVCAALSQVGHLVDAVQEGQIARCLIEERTYDLLVLDWMLPGYSGVELCRRHRQLGRSAPVLMLTAKDTTADKVTGLDAGADDYLVKPIDLLELLARVRALGRRSPLWVGEVLTLDDLTLTLPTMALCRGDAALTLSTREFQLMEYFLRHPGQVLSRDQIETNLWEWDSPPESNAVSTLVRRLRRRLEELGAEDWIETIYGTGYRLKAQERA